MQVTVSKISEFRGFGLHSGLPVRLVVEPAPENHGIVFHRTDLPASDRVISATIDNWTEARLCTRLVNRVGASVSTVEHLMAALAGCGIHNALVRLNGPEVPILDGSAAPFVRKFVAAGLREQRAPLEVIRILRPVEVRHNGAMARLDPADGFEIGFEIDFPDAAIGRQVKTLDLANGAFARDLADARTFCRRADVEAMQAAGLALGGSYDNAVVVEGARVLSPGGLRHADEPVRHKMLDALGDLAVAGAPILGRYTGLRAGHAMTGHLLRAVMADPTTHLREHCSPACQKRLPGGLRAFDELPLTA